MVKNGIESRVSSYPPRSTKHQTNNPLQGAGGIIPQPSLIVFDHFFECFGGHNPIVKGKAKIGMKVIKC
jgi:hypothetical protein